MELDPRYTKHSSPMGWLVFDGEKDTGIIVAGNAVRRHGIWCPTLEAAIHAYEKDRG
jgi:hypothetical protein